MRINDRKIRRQLQTLDDAQLQKVHGGWEIQGDGEISSPTDASTESRYNFTSAWVSKISLSTLKS
jgi:hypothetical protein